MSSPRAGEPINLLMTCNRFFTKPFLSSLYSIWRNTKRPIRLFFMGELDNYGPASINRSFPGVEFHVVARNDVSTYLRVIENVAVTQLFPFECLLRLIVPFFLSETIDKLLYIDCDTITDGDIGELFDIELSTSLGAVQDVAYVGSLRQISSLGISGYFYSGVLLFDLRLLRTRHNLGELELVLQKIGLSHAFPDQDILNVWFLNDKTILPLRYNNASYRGYTIEKVQMNSLVYHYCGRIKPWDNHWICLPPLRLFWRYARRFYGFPYYFRNFISTRIHYLREKHGRRRASH